MKICSLKLLLMKFFVPRKPALTKQIKQYYIDHQICNPILPIRTPETT